MDSCWWSPNFIDPRLLINQQGLLIMFRTSFGNLLQGILFLCHWIFLQKHLATRSVDPQLIPCWSPVTSSIPMKSLDSLNFAWDFQKMPGIFRRIEPEWHDTLSNDTFTICSWPEKHGKATFISGGTWDHNTRHPSWRSMVDPVVKSLLRWTFLGRPKMVTMMTPWATDWDLTSF